MSNFFFRPTSNPLPLLIREESSGSALSPDASKDAMLAQLRDFVSHLNTDAMVRFAASGNQ